MASRRRKSNVVKMKKRARIRTGVILLLFSAYLLVLFIQSITKSHVSIYEVTEKQIADDSTVRGIILRDEKLVKSDASGFINYYVGEGSKIGAATKVYSVDSDGTIYNQLRSAATKKIDLTSDNTNEIRNSISAFRDAYNLSHYEETYNFKYNIDNTVLELSNTNLLNNLTKIMEQQGADSSFDLIKAGESGVISYSSDGMEGLTVNKLKEKSFTDMTDKLTQLRKTKSINAGSPVYKLVKSENWSVVVPLTREQFQTVQSKKTISVTLKKIDARCTPTITTFLLGRGYYAKLDFSRYMIQYLNNRYLDIELDLNRADGLKIPNTSIMKKMYYIVPNDYVTNIQGDNGLTIKDSSGEKVFVAANVLYQDDPQAKECYVEMDKFTPGSVVYKPTGEKDSYTLTKSQRLEGVYNCNKGYCEFRRITKIYQNSEYSIVSKDTVNGLSAYDHIILNPDVIKEDDIIY